MNKSIKKKRVSKSINTTCLAAALMQIAVVESAASVQDVRGSVVYAVDPGERTPSAPVAEGSFVLHNTQQARIVVSECIRKIFELSNERHAPDSVTDIGNMQLTAASIHQIIMPFVCYFGGENHNRAQELREAERTYRRRTNDLVMNTEGRTGAEIAAIREAVTAEYLTCVNDTGEWLYARLLAFPPWPMSKPVSIPIAPASINFRCYETIDPLTSLTSLNIKAKALLAGVRPLERIQELAESARQTCLVGLGYAQFGYPTIEKLNGHEQRLRELIRQQRAAADGGWLRNVIIRRRIEKEIAAIEGISGILIAEKRARN
jgi:hypothetical protein